MARQARRVRLDRPEQNGRGPITHLELPESSSQRRMLQGHPASAFFCLDPIRVDL
jgi:hypothetical protein